MRLINNIVYTLVSFLYFEFWNKWLVNQVLEQDVEGLLLAYVEMKYLINSCIGSLELIKSNTPPTHQEGGLTI